MQKICCLILFLNIYFFFPISAQQQFQVRRIINCHDNFRKDVFGVTYDSGVLSDSPNLRFMPIGRELQKTLVNWVQENQVQAYHYTEKMADFSQKMDEETFINKLTYYDKALQDSIIFPISDLHEIGIEEMVSYENGRFTYDIQAVVLYIAQIDAELEFRKREAVARFNYEELAKLWEKTYKKTLRKKSYSAIQCFIQLYDDNFKTVSFTDAFEKRYFNAKIDTVIPQDKNKTLEKEAKYQPKLAQVGSIWYLPQFSENKRGRIKTSIYETIDLRKEPEFFKDNNALVTALIQGIEEKEITPYYFDLNANYNLHFKKKNIMPKSRIDEQWTYYDYYFGDSINLRNIDLCMIELQSIVKIKKNKQVNFKPQRLSILIPAGTRYDAIGDIRFVTLKYREIAKYLNKLVKQSEEFTFNTQTKNISFAKALSQRRFSGTIRKYDTFFDKAFMDFYLRLYGFLHYPTKTTSELKHQSKLVIEYIKSLGK